MRLIDYGNRIEWIPISEATTTVISVAASWSATPSPISFSPKASTRANSMKALAVGFGCLALALIIGIGALVWRRYKRKRLHHEAMDNEMDQIEVVEIGFQEKKRIKSLELDSMAKFELESVGSTPVELMADGVRSEIVGKEIYEKGTW